MNPLIQGGRGPFPYDRGEHLIVPIGLWSFADESGIQREQGYCIIAGLVARPDIWESFNAEWQAVLDDPDFQDEQFHSIDFFGGREHYRKWEGDKRNWYLSRLLNVLAGAVKQGAVLPRAVAVHQDAFHGFTDGERRWLTGGGQSGEGAAEHAYFVLFQQYVLRLLLQVQGNALVHFYFDRQKAYRDRAIAIFTEMEDALIASDPKYRSVIDDITFRKSLGQPGLQAAELLAYTWRSRLMDDRDARLVVAARALLRDEDMHIVDAAELDLSLRAIP